MQQGHSSGRADRPAQHHGTPADPGRRRFGRLGVSGVLLTLASKPVLGAVAQTPSGFLSANQSTHGPQEMSYARGPEYWTGNDVWPIPRDTKFQNVFSIGPASPLNDVTLADVVKGHPGDAGGVARYAVAAYLNACAGLSPFLSAAQVQTMYLEWQSRGYYEPMASVQWGAADIVHYLAATQS